MGVFNRHVGQVTYPRMERQDLTQAQLGAFKFTPTDEVRPVFTNLSPLFSPTRHHASTQFSHFTNHDFNQHNLQVSTSPTRVDSTFFNTYIKPDLTNSRIRLGPNVVRAAVDGASPSHKSQHWDAEAFRQAIRSDIMQSNVSSQSILALSVYLADHTQQHQSFGNDCHSANSNLNPAVPIFSAATNGTGVDDSNALYTSLIRALASEQQAHQMTKHALESEKTARVEAETDAQKWLEHNRSLIGSVNLLKSVLQHNMKKEQEQAQQVETPSHHNRSKAPSSEETTILHDAVLNLNATPKDFDDGASIEQSNDDVVSFDLDIPDTPEYASLRKHFSDSTESVSQLQIEPMDSDQLISISSEETALHSVTVQSVKLSNKSLHNPTKDTEPTVLKNKPNTESLPTIMAMPFDVPVKWIQGGIFEDDQDKINHLGFVSAQRMTNFYKHPVRYLPRKSEKNLYRTVMIDFIPQGTEYAEILKNVRGGAIESVQLFDPIGSSTDFMTARIVFNYELGARSVYMHGQKTGLRIKGQKVRVWQVLEPTYPRNANLENEIFEEGYTRLLLIENATDTALAMLPTKLAYQFKAGFVINVTRSYDNLPMVEFTSVAECSRALHILINDADFGGSRFDFEEDPCCDAY